MASAIASAAAAAGPCAGLKRAQLRVDSGIQSSTGGTGKLGRSSAIAAFSSSVSARLRTCQSSLSGHPQGRYERRCVAVAAAADSTSVEWDDQGPSDVNPTDLTDSEDERGREAGWRGGRSEEERAQSDSRQELFNNIAPMYDDAHVFAVVFGTVSTGAVVLTLNVQLLGGRIIFFQSLSLLGYCLVPLDLAALLCLLTTAKHVRMALVLVTFAWSSSAAYPFVAKAVPETCRVLAVYPVFLLYTAIGFLVLAND